MKNLKKSLLIVAFALSMSMPATTTFAQGIEVSTGVDYYSTYVWRGVSYSGPSLQPSVEVSMGGFSLGAWGSQGFDGFQEMDFYVGYEMDFGLSLGITDYFYPSTSTSPSGPFLDTDSHAYELNTGYSIDALSVSANYIFAGGGSSGEDIYLEAGFSFDKADVFIGAGNGWHTSNEDFAIVNVGISTSKEISITDSFSIPVSGAVVLNPETEDVYIVVGLSF